MSTLALNTCANQALYLLMEHTAAVPPPPDFPIPLVDNNGDFLVDNNGDILTDN